ncbi:Fic family protein [Mangrovicoccus algicola]|uniref:hypothetical protein n=1 Tax=Mangrovicoccus algicola TaxID=2771008 RepID=UPI001D018D79|nr:hypothetical protein [Mangrovicoccus algicola]
MADAGGADLADAGAVNGRIGRAIIEHVFATEAALPFSLSRQIEADKRGYYAALQAGRRIAGDAIEATPFVRWLLNRLEAGIDGAGREARFLVRRNAFLSAHAGLPERPMSVLRRLFAAGEDRVGQGLSAGPYGKMAKVSPTTAPRDRDAIHGDGAAHQHAHASDNQFEKAAIAGLTRRSDGHAR